MAYLKCVLGITAVLCLTAACMQQINYSKQQEEARTGLDTLLAQLPIIADFNVVKIVHLEFSDTAYGKTCYYARAYVIVGSSLPELEAMSSYADKLRSLEWKPKNDPYDTSVLYRGMNARAVITSGEPGVDIKNAVDYSRLREIYRSIIFISVDYMVPSRQDC